MIPYRYMLWKLKEIGLTERQIVKEIRAMRLAFVKEQGSTSVKTVLERMTPEQMQIYSSLELGRFISN